MDLGSCDLGCEEDSVEFDYGSEGILDQDAVVKVECQVRGFLCHGACDNIIVDRDYCDGYQDVYIVGPRRVVTGRKHEYERHIDRECERRRCW